MAARGSCGAAWACLGPCWSCGWPITVSHSQRHELGARQVERGVGHDVVQSNDHSEHSLGELLRSVVPARDGSVHGVSISLTAIGRVPRCRAGFSRARSCRRPASRSGSCDTTPRLAPRGLPDQGPASAGATGRLDLLGTTQPTTRVRRTRQGDQPLPAADPQHSRPRPEQCPLRAATNTPLAATAPPLRWLPQPRRAHRHGSRSADHEPTHGNSSRCES
jgi:hypothetical protein